MYALKILLVFGVEKGIRHEEQGVFFNLKKGVDVARISLNPEKKWIRTLQKPPSVDSDSRVKLAEKSLQ